MVSYFQCDANDTLIACKYQTETKLKCRRKCEASFQGGKWHKMGSSKSSVFPSFSEADHTAFIYIHSFPLEELTVMPITHIYHSEFSTVCIRNAIDVVEAYEINEIIV